MECYYYCTATFTFALTITSVVDQCPHVSILCTWRNWSNFLLFATHFVHCISQFCQWWACNCACFVVDRMRSVERGIWFHNGQRTEKGENAILKFTKCVFWTPSSHTCLRIKFDSIILIGDRNVAKNKSKMAAYLPTKSAALLFLLATEIWPIIQI